MTYDEALTKAEEVFRPWIIRKEIEVYLRKQGDVFYLDIRLVAANVTWTVTL
jgi:hypothetical protein